MINRESNTLSEKLWAIADLQEEYSRYGVSFSLKGDDPLRIIPSSYVAGYVIDVLERSGELLSRLDMIETREFSP